MGLDDFERELAAQQAKGSSKKRERSGSRERRHRHSSSRVRSYYLFMSTPDNTILTMWYSTPVADTMAIIAPHAITTATPRTPHIGSTSAQDETTRMTPSQMKSV
jgi:hypothetical protein